MVILWPGFLYLLGLIPILIAVYIWMLKRRRRFAVRYSSLSLVRQALPRQSQWRRHLPFALFLLALSSLLVALSRPVNIISVPTDQTTIILTIDVSGSMRSTDIKPTRLLAAEQAALDFIQLQKSGTQIGIVAFSNFAEIIQSPTTDQEALQAAVQSLTTGRRTAIGDGILRGIDAIAEVDKNVPPSVSDPTAGNEPAPVPKGAYVPDIVVLLTDGVSNTGMKPMDAAKEAADRGIRVYTIGFGTMNGEIQDPGGFGGGGVTGGFGGGGRGFRTGIDEATLKQIAELTGGTYHPAASAAELQDVFNGLPTYLITKHEVMEISVVFTAFGALLAAAAVLLGLSWHPLL
jgi:Ca-activated chloride channel family protein